MTLTTTVAVVSPPGEDSAWDTAVSAESPSHFRPDIEGLRAIAILAVLGFHTRLPGFGGGFVGVDVFFVISGFLITGLLLREIKAKGGIDFSAFYARRARRLLPAALIVIVFTLVASALVLSPVRFPEVARDGGAAALYVSNYRFAFIATDYFAADSLPSPLLHFWSLAVEEQFYLFWPLIVIGLARVFSVRYMWPAVVGLVIASYVLTIVVAGIEPAWAFYSLPTRAWQLALGALVALGVLSLPAHWPNWLGSVLGLVGLVLIAEAVVVVDGTTPYGISGLLPAVGAALFIIGGDRTGAIPARVLATSMPRWFGRISYSLYLWHWPILILIPIAIGHGGLRVRVALAVLSIGVAAASTRFIETPFRVRRLSTSSSRTLLVAAGCSVAIAFLAVATSGQFVRGTEGAPLPTLGAATAEQPPLPKPVLSGPLPDDLQPTLVDAGRDRAAPGLEECRSGLTESDPRDCVYGKRSFRSHCGRVRRFARRHVASGHGRAGR